MSVKNTVITLSAAMLAMAAGFYYATTHKTPFDDQSSYNRQNFSPIQGNIIDPPRKIALPELSRQDGALLSEQDYKGHWTLWFFGYTHCPDICPATLGMAAAAKRKADNEGIEFPQVIFVSVDPERDTVELLKDYVSYFDPGFIGVTGSEDMIKALTLQMSVVYMKMASESDDGNNYIVDHSSSLLVTNPRGHLTATLSPPHSPASVLKDLETLYHGYQ
jgi:protein SCO1